MTSPRESHAGFSLSEVVGSIAVLVVVALALPARRAGVPALERESVRAHFDLLVRALDAHFVDTGRWPFEPMAETSLEPVSLAGLFVDDSRLPGWAGPYLAPSSEPEPGDAQGAQSPMDGGLRDPWGREYRLHAYSKGQHELSLVLWSGGPNGQRETDARGLRAGRARGDDLVLRTDRPR